VAFSVALALDNVDRERLGAVGHSLLQHCALVCRTGRAGAVRMCERGGPQRPSLSTAGPAPWHRLVAQARPQRRAALAASERWLSTSGPRRSGANVRVRDRESPRDPRAPRNVGGGPCLLLEPV
jgi:hypothetical protein